VTNIEGWRKGKEKRDFEAEMGDEKIRITDEIHEIQHGIYDSLQPLVDLAPKEESRTDAVVDIIGGIHGTMGQFLDFSKKLGNISDEEWHRYTELKKTRAHR